MSDDQTPSRDPLYFGRWFSQLLRDAAHEIGEGGSVSKLPLLAQVEIMQGIRYLNDLENSPIKLEFVSATRRTEAGTGNIVATKTCYSVAFPWGKDLEFVYLLDRGASAPFASGDMANSYGLLDLAMCIDTWLSDGMRKPEFSMPFKDDADPAEAQQRADDNRETIATFEVIKALGVSKSTFHNWIENSPYNSVARGIYYKDEMQQLARDHQRNL